MLKTLLRILLVLILAVVGLALVGVWSVRAYLDVPAGGSARVTLHVKRGDTLKPVLDDLADRGVLRHPRWLYYYARFENSTEVRTGDYEILATSSPREILAALHEGRIELESFTLPEGLNRWQVRDFLVDHGWLSAADFERLCDDRDFLRQNNIPGPSCDGYLFPETYTFARGVAARKIFEEMFATFHRVVNAVTAGGRGPLSLDTRELATLASIVEKETGAPEERPRIACVFYNRLQAKPMWRLDTDPTVIYAAMLADPTFDGNLKREHLRKLDSPYNTYRIKGLPPGPIANAGRAAFVAVVSPAACKDFFFVSMNNGRHEFCPTLDCHNRAVEKWQVQYFQRHRP